MTELNAAEQAAAEALQYICWHTGPSTDPASLCGECDKAARAVVAAVRGPIAAEILNAAADSWPMPWPVAGEEWLRKQAKAFEHTATRAAERQAEGSE